VFAAVAAGAGGVAKHDRVTLSAKAKRSCLNR
jgi:hypothetical protein